MLPVFKNCVSDNKLVLRANCQQQLSIWVTLSLSTNVPWLILSFTPYYRIVKGNLLAATALLRFAL